MSSDITSRWLCIGHWHWQNGQRLLELYSHQELCITNTYFKGTLSQSVLGIIPGLVTDTSMTMPSHIIAISTLFTIPAPTTVLMETLTTHYMCKSVRHRENQVYKTIDIPIPCIKVYKTIERPSLLQSPKQDPSNSIQSSISNFRSSIFKETKKNIVINLRVRPEEELW